MRRTSSWAIVTLAAAFAVGIHGACDQHPYPQGQAIYEYKCGNCHMNDGAGLVGNIPPLAGADWLVEQRDQLACTIRYGMEGTMKVNGLSYNGVMQGFPDLTDTELTNVANYILTAWGNNLEPLKANQVGDMLKECARDKPIKVGNPQTLR